MAERPPGPQGRALAALMLWPVLFVGLTIMLHECGHWFAARAPLVPEPTLHFDRTEHGDVAGIAAWKLGAVALAGPAVTIVLIGAGLAIANRSARPAHLALAAAAASRFAVGVPYTLIALALAVTGPRLAAPAFDEARAAIALGLLPEALMTVSTAAFLAAMVGVWLLLPSGRRLLGMGALIVGTALGWALWMLILGPRLLP